MVSYTTKRPPPPPAQPLKPAFLEGVEEVRRGYDVTMVAQRLKITASALRSACFQAGVLAPTSVASVKTMRAFRARERDTRIAQAKHLHAEGKSVEEIAHAVNRRSPWVASVLGLTGMPLTKTARGQRALTAAKQWLALDEDRRSRSKLVDLARAHDAAYSTVAKAVYNLRLLGLTAGDVCVTPSTVQEQRR